MSTGVLYVMSTVVSGLIKIGKTTTDRFDGRMYELEHNGYRNVTGLRRRFAIEVEDYDEKERMLDDIFSKARVPLGPNCSRSTSISRLSCSRHSKVVKSIRSRVQNPRAKSSTTPRKTIRRIQTSNAFPKAPTILTENGRRCTWRWSSRMARSQSARGST